MQRKKKLEDSTNKWAKSPDNKLLRLSISGGGHFYVNDVSTIKLNILHKKINNACAVRIEYAVMYLAHNDGSNH